MLDAKWIPTLLAIAWLLPLAGFAVEIFAGWWQTSRKDKTAAGLAVACIATGFVCSFLALITWGQHTDWAALKDTGHGSHGAAHDGGHDEHGDAAMAEDDHAAKSEEASGKDHAKAGDIDGPLSGKFYTLAR